MKSALYYIFKKNIWIVATIIILFFVTKCYTAHSLEEKKDHSALNTWIAQCKNMTGEEIESFISDLSIRLSENPNFDKNEINDFSMFVSSYQNVKNVNRLIGFAKNKEGVLPVALPDNYMELLEFYGNLNEPEVINRGTLDNYYELQKYSIVNFVAILLIAFFWGQHYELEIYKYVVTTPRGKSYNQTVRFSIFTMNYLFLFINELFDMLYSGLLQNPQMLKASVQSYSVFVHAQNNATLSECLVIAFIGKVVTVYIICTGFEIIARNKKNAKDTVINSICILILLFFVRQGLLNTGYSSIVQIGIVDWKDVIAKSTQLMRLNISTLELGCIVSCTIGVIMGIVYYKKPRQLC